MTKFDLVITDLYLMNINCLDLSKKISNINPDIPIVMSTGSGELDVETIKEAGLSALHNPFSITDIENVINKIQDSRQ